MKRTCLLTLLLTSLTWTFSARAHAGLTCDDFTQLLKNCRDKIIGTYGQQLVITKKGPDGKIEKLTRACTKGKDVRKTCGVGNFCVKAPGSAFSFCYQPGSIYYQYKDMLAEISTLCDPIFTSRQGGPNSYLTCVQNANCDLKKINQCRTLLKREKKTPHGTALLGFLLFLLASLLCEGILVFGAVKLIDRHNPRNTITRAVVLSLIVGVFTFPAVYTFPLLGMLLSGSLLFGLIIVFYQQDVFLPAVFTAFHVLWVSAFFTYTVAGAQLGNAAWLAQPKTLRVHLLNHHAELEESIQEFEREQRGRKAKAAKKAAKK